MKIKVDVVDGNYTFAIHGRDKSNPRSKKVVMDIDSAIPKTKKKTPAKK